MSGHRLDTMAQRLRAFADELEAAERYGVPVPECVSAFHHEYGDVSFSCTPEEFDAWAAYTEGTVEEYEHAGQNWRRVSRVDVNGLPFTFATTVPAEVTA